MKNVGTFLCYIFTLAGNSSTANCQRPAATYGAPLLLLLPF